MQARFFLSFNWKDYWISSLKETQGKNPTCYGHFFLNENSRSEKQFGSSGKVSALQKDISRVCWYKQLKSLGIRLYKRPFLNLDYTKGISRQAAAVFRADQPLEGSGSQVPNTPWKKGNFLPSFHQCFSLNHTCIQHSLDAVLDVLGVALRQQQEVRRSVRRWHY